MTVDDGDPYTSALADAFADAFRDLGGEVPAAVTIREGQTDMTAVLAELAPASPDGIFFPLFLAEGSPFAARSSLSCRGISRMPGFASHGPADLPSSGPL